MFVLLLMLDNPQLMDRVMQAWTALGLRGIYMLESTGCREPAGEACARRGTGLLAFSRLLEDARYCHALLVAAVESLSVAEQAADEVMRIAGPGRERRTARMFALPVAASWGAVFDSAPEAGEGGQAEEERGAP